MPIEELPPINNDHVVDAGRGLIYLSANDGHIYVAPIEGGTAKRVTHDSSRYHFLHGVSPDGATLAFVELPRANFTVPGRLAFVSSAGGQTRYPQAGAATSTAPSTHPTVPGCTSIARSTRAVSAMRNWPAYPPRVGVWSVWWTPSRSTGSRTSRRTASTRPISASLPARLGTRPTSTCEVRLVRTADWCHVVSSFPLFGGQGTLNVNSWSPDGRWFGFVAYPVHAETRSTMTEPGFESLFDGVSLTGWSAIPRHYGQLYPGGPDVLDVNTDFPRDYQDARGRPSCCLERRGRSHRRPAAARGIGVRRVPDLRP